MIALSSISIALNSALPPSCTCAYRPGVNARSGFGTTARRLIVPVAESTWLLTKLTVPEYGRPVSLARREVVGAEDVHAARRVADDVVLEGHALHDHPRRGAVLIARREDDRIARLIGDPEVLEHVAFDDDV